MNSGTITATGTNTIDEIGVDLEAGGYVATSGRSAVVAGFGEGVAIGSLAGTVVNSGTITGETLVGVILGAGGYAMNQGTIFGGDYGLWAETQSATVVNAGTIFGASGAGVQLDAGGAVTNDGTAALISGGVDGVDINYIHGGAPSTVTNEGTIVSRSGFGTHGVGVVLNNGGYVGNSGKASLIQGYGGGVDIANAAGTVVNSGKISVTGTAGIGVFLAGGYVVNRGTIAGGASHLGAGVVSHVAVIAGVAPPPATVVNDATIFGGGWGVELQAGSVTNSGTASMISKSQAAARQNNRVRPAIRNLARR